jgi:hypothetical protein
MGCPKQRKQSQGGAKVGGQITIVTIRTAIRVAIGIIIIITEELGITITTRIGIRLRIKIK